MEVTIAGQIPLQVRMLAVLLVGPEAMGALTRVTPQVQAVEGMAETTDFLA